MYDDDDLRDPSAPSTIGNQHAAESAVDDFAQRYMALFAQSPLSIQILSPEGYTLQVNRAWEELWGISLDRLAGYNMLEDHQLVEKGIMPYIAKGFSGEATVIPAIMYDPEETVPSASVHKDARRWVSAFIYPLKDALGRVREVVLIHENVTEIVLARQQAIDSEARLQVALDAAEMGVWDWDTRTGRIWWTEQLEPIHGMERGTFDGTFDSYLSVVHEDDRAGLIAAVRSAMDAGTDYYTEFRVSFSDGRIRWIAGKGRGFLDDAGRPIRMIGVGMDITERKESEKERDRLLEKQARIAETLQRSMLATPIVGQLAGFEIARRYESAGDEALVGGDFYDVFRVDEYHLALVVGDITGKGLRAASDTAEVKYTLRAVLRESITPDAALRRLNNLICRSSDLDDLRSANSYVSLSLAVIDVRTGAVAAASAGADPPILLGVNGSSRPLSCGGMLLGAVSDQEYTAARARIESGDIILLATDGIVEARSRKEFLGTDGLIEAVRKVQGPSLDKMADDLLQHALAFTGGKLQDDACVLLARRE
jgi:PAS domain S-box-containing protein